MNNFDGKRSSIFLSWKGPLSKNYATVFHKFLEELGIKELVFFSDKDVAKGDEWRRHVINGIRKSRVVVAFITKENVGIARWMECEAAAVWLAHEGTLVFPFLIDIKRDEIPSNSAWEGPLDGASYCEPTFLDVEKMLTRIRDECGIEVFKDLKTTAGQILKLEEKWSKLRPNMQNIAPSASNSASPVSVLNCFSSDDEFAAWAYQFHRISHHARDLTVHILDRFAPLSEPGSALTDSLKPLRSHDPLPAMLMFKTEIKEMLDVVEFVFNELVKRSGATVWVCLRDLRGDGRYHNFLRSAHGHGPGRDALSVPWPMDCDAIADLRLTTELPESGTDAENISGRNCTIITDPSKKNWPPYKEGLIDPRRKESILGAVLLKKVTDYSKEPDQSTMWWVLCVNSDKPSVFSLAHRKLLQTCNDAFSVVANALLRASMMKG